MQTEKESQYRFLFFSRFASPFRMQLDHICFNKMNTYLNWQQFKCYNSNRHAKRIMNSFFYERNEFMREKKLCRATKYYRYNSNPTESSINHNCNSFCVVNFFLFSLSRVCILGSFFQGRENLRSWQSEEEKERKKDRSKWNEKKNVIIFHWTEILCYKFSFCY